MRKTLPSGSSQSARAQGINTTKTSVMAVKDQQDGADSVPGPSDPAKATTVQNVSAELYTEEDSVTGNETAMSKDSFVMDTQMLRLISALSPSAQSVPSEVVTSTVDRGSDSPQQSASMDPQTPVVAQGAATMANTGVDENPCVREQTPQMFSEGINDELDATTADYMNRFCTQVDIGEKSASPSLSAQSRAAKDSSVVMDSSGLDLGECGLETGLDEAVLYSTEGESDGELVPASCFEREVAIGGESQLAGMYIEQDNRDDINVGDGTPPLQSYRSPSDPVIPVACDRKSTPNSMQYAGLQEDLAIAMGMSESFSSPTAVDSKASKPRIHDRKNTTTPPGICGAVKDLTPKSSAIPGDSLTFSMLQRELDCDIEQSGVAENAGGNHGNSNGNEESKPGNSKTVTGVNIQSNSKQNGPSQPSRKTGRNTSLSTSQILDAMCDSSRSSRKKPPSKAKKTQAAEDLVGKGVATDVSVKDRVRHKRKSEDSDQPTDQQCTAPKLTKTADQANQSVEDDQASANISDYVPPTPPQDAGNKTPHRSYNTPGRLIGGACGTPAKNATPCKTLAQQKSCITPHRSSRKQRLPRCMTPKGGTAVRGCVSSPTPSLPCSDQMFSIIDVAADDELFQHFVTEWKTKARYSISVSCDTKPARQTRATTIGGNFQKGKKCLVKII